MKEIIVHTSDFMYHFRNKERDYDIILEGDDTFVFIDSIETRLTGIKWQKNLSRLYLWGGNISEITLPPNLEKLEICHCNLDASKIYLPKKLKSLTLFANNFGDTYFTNFPKNLKKLTLQRNNTMDLTKIKFPKNLEKLDISENGITDMSNIQIPRNLKRLDISKNIIEILPKLPHKLKEINLRYNKIRVIKDLPENLKVLDFIGNPIKELQIPEHIEHISWFPKEFITANKENCKNKRNLKILEEIICKDIIVEISKYIINLNQKFFEHL